MSDQLDRIHLNICTIPWQGVAEIVNILSLGVVEYSTPFDGVQTFLGPVKNRSIVKFQQGINKFEKRYKQISI